MYSTVQEWVFPFIKNLHGDRDSAYAKYMGDAIFKIPTPLILDKIVTAMDEIYEQMAQLKRADTRGDVYEYLLSKLATAGVNGQFRTPRHIIKMIVELMDPGSDEIICDPACGTSGFLVVASEYLKENKKEEVLFDRKNKQHYMNHMFHGCKSEIEIYWKQLNEEERELFNNNPICYFGKDMMNLEMKV